MSIIDLNQRRQAADPGYASCPCGEAWFELRNTEGPAPRGALSLTKDGRVNGYSGQPYCISCGRPFS